MFDRGTGYTQEKMIPVKLEMDNGAVLTGHLKVSQSASLGDVMNDNKSYLEFTTYEGQQQFLSKTAIRTVQKIERPEEADQLLRHFNQLNGFNPYTVLGVRTDASKADLQQAYHGLAKDYHPDRYSNMTLPSEVMQYMNAMSKRINAAHSELTSIRTSQRVTV